MPHEVVIEIRVQPRAKKEEICGFRDGVLRVRLTAPPVDNTANQALIKLLAKHLKVPKGSISLVRGGRSRDKAVALKGLSEGDVQAVFQDCQSR